MSSICIIIVLFVLLAVASYSHIRDFFKVLGTGWTFREYRFIKRTLWLSIDRREFLDLMEVVKRTEKYYEEEGENE